MVQQMVWVVEDEETDWELLRRILTAHRVPAFHFNSVEDLLRTLQVEGPPALILLDLVLPGRSGFDFLLQRKSDPLLASIPVIAMSGVCDPRGAAQVMGLRASFEKPVTWEKLAPELAKLGLLREP